MLPVTLPDGGQQLYVVIAYCLPSGEMILV